MTDTYSAEKSVFDPSQPFDVADSGKPPFDPAKPFEAMGQTEAFTRALHQGVTANFGDEITGLRAAGGAAGNVNILGIPVGPIIGAGRLGYEKLTGNPGDATKSYETARDTERKKNKEAETEFPKTNLAGNVIGSVVVPVGGMFRAATLPARMARGSAAGAVFGAASGAGEGEGAADTATRAAIGAPVGAVFGGLVPPLVEGAVQGGSALIRPIAAAVRGAINPESEAARRVTGAIARDIHVDPGAESRLTPQEFGASVQRGGPAMVMDLGGETTRALARSAANISPEGRQTLTRTIDDRFEGQAGRVSDWLRQTFNYPNAHAQQEAIDQTARTVNRGAYAHAYRQGDRPIWSPELERLTSSPDIVDAMRDAATKGKSRAVTQGFGGFNPGVTVDNGIVTFQRGANGVPTYPNLQFWDYTKRALDDATNAARRAGRNEEASTLGNLARSLRNELDQHVPEFAQARAGAAHFFGAENALEAGQNFVTSRLANDEARAALARMNPNERQLFQDGFVSRFVESINETGDRRNVLNTIAQSPAARERLMMVLGHQRATQLEAGLRVEGIMDMARGAVGGNSTTVRQWIEHGLAGGAGGLGLYGSYNLSPSEMTTAAVTGALLAGRRGIDHRVARHVAEMLVSHDPQVLARGVNILARNNNLMQALRSADLNLARTGAQQSANVPALQSAGIGRADQNEPQVPRPPGQ